jgi:hypothetical protein
MFVVLIDSEAEPWKEMPPISFMETLPNDRRIAEFDEIPFNESPVLIRIVDV